MSWPKRRRESTEEDGKNRLNLGHRRFAAWLQNDEPDRIDGSQQNMPNIDAVSTGQEDEYSDVDAHNEVDKVALNICPPIARTYRITRHFERSTKARPKT